MSFLPAPMQAATSSGQPFQYDRSTSFILEVSREIKEEEEMNRAAGFLCCCIAASLASQYGLIAICGALGAPQVPAMFAFGDSTIDNGNSNFKGSIARANYCPYGVDFPEGATGRFANKENILDVIGDLLGLAYLPSYYSTVVGGGGNATGLLGGVNYASGSAGILEETGQHLGERDPLSQQVLNFQSDLEKIKPVLGCGRNFTRYLARSIVVIAVGSNDYVNNFLIPALYSSSYDYSPLEFASLLLHQYKMHILELISIGMRKLLLIGLGPLGCIPEQRSSGVAPPGQCVDRVNEMVCIFNQGLKSLTQQLITHHPAVIITFSNTYRVLQGILGSPRSFGFGVVDRSCCSIARTQTQRLYCERASLPCASRQTYVYWDGLHTTHAANRILGQRAFTGPRSDVYPINIQQLAHM